MPLTGFSAVRQGCSTYRTSVRRRSKSAMETSIEQTFARRLATAAPRYWGRSSEWDEARSARRRTEGLWRCLTKHREAAVKARTDLRERGLRRVLEGRDKALRASPCPSCLRASTTQEDAATTSPDVRR